MLCSPPTPAAGLDIDSAVLVHSITSTVLEAPPSCIEFSGLAPDLFVVGTYSLDVDNVADAVIASAINDEETNQSIQSRRGSLVLFQVRNNTLLALQTVLTSSAVLDLHFSPHQKTIFAVATSTGCVELYSLTLENVPHIDFRQELRPIPSTILVLSLTWHPSPQMQTTLAVSLSDGRVALLDYHQDPICICFLQAHSLEAWTISWSLFSDPTSHVLYSGGDDSRLCSMTIMQTDMNEKEFGIPSQTMILSRESEYNTDEETDSQMSKEERKLNLPPRCLTGFDAKVHYAGVTAILPVLISDETKVEVLITGSYDEYIRVLTPRINGKWDTVLEHHLGGGVWRLKMLKAESCLLPHKMTRFKILASCMHAGSRIVELCYRVGMPWTIRILARFEEHESMNYGSDATRLKDAVRGRRDVFIAVSTSFYDKKLCVWDILETCDPPSE